MQAWELAIAKTGSYLYSRFILAVLSTAFHWIALAILGVPYALALALWVGIVSQFIPVVGTYLAGALAVLVALLNDPFDGVAILIFVIVYQQVENYIFVPRVTAQTLELHPAVAFGTVIAGAAILGPVGALLALPAAAVVQAFISTLGERHEVVESELTAEQHRKPRRRWFRRTQPDVDPDDSDDRHVAPEQRVRRAVVRRARRCPASSSAAIRPASFLPSSTPHWSNESMPQIAPSVSTLCSYAAIERAERARARAGRRATRSTAGCRACTRYGSTRLRSPVPNASASACASRLQNSRSLVTRQLEAGLRRARTR